MKDGMDEMHETDETKNTQARFLAVKANEATTMLAAVLCMMKEEGWEEFLALTKEAIVEKAHAGANAAKMMFGM